MHKSDERQSVGVRGIRLGARSARRLAGATPAALYLSAARTALADAFERENEQGRVALWAPVAFLCGIAVYFMLPREPLFGALAALAAGFAAARLVLARRGRPTLAVTALAVFATGLCAAKLETDRMLAPRLETAVTAEVTGVVERVEPAQRKRSRLTIRPESISGVDPGLIPRRIRISALDPERAVRAGDRISFRGRLSPPPGPALPGGYDFAFAAYFDERGAGGYAFGRVDVLAPAPGTPSLTDRLALAVERLRGALGQRIAETLEGPREAVARALIVGEREAIPDPVVDDLRLSGLAHILAISGLHMVLLTASVFWSLRALLALSPKLALDYPIKKWASAAAFVAAFFYLLTSGASVATERAFVMVGVALLAILVDRPALTLRTLALAAFAVAALHPHAVLGPSFQMSFVAVTALIGLSEWLSERMRPGTRHPGSWLSRRLGSVWLYVAGLAATSLIAGAATTPIAAFHFHTMAPLGLLGNLAAMPIVGFVIMPAGFLACLLAPLGLDPPLFWLMGWGIDQVLAIATIVAQLSEGMGNVGRIPVVTPLLAAFGILWLAIWQYRWRWAGLGFIAAGIALAPLADRPAVLINEEGTAVLTADPGAAPTLVRDRGAAFETGIWLKSYGDARSVRDQDLAAGFSCDSQGCVRRLARQPGSAGDSVAGNAGGPLVVALARDPDALLEDCYAADIVVSRFPAPDYCPNPREIFDRSRLAATGAVALYRNPDGALRVQTARSPIARPWHAPNRFIARASPEPVEESEARREQQAPDAPRPEREALNTGE